MRKSVVLMVTMVLLSAGACRQQAAHMPPEALAPILADLHLADAYSGMVRDTLHPEIGKNYDSLAVWTKSILAKHRVTREEFSRSMDWYRDNPTELDSLYARVIPILEKNRP